jgi:hypothetical protein
MSEWRMSTQGVLTRFRDLLDEKEQEIVVLKMAFDRFFELWTDTPEGKRCVDGK